MRKALIILLIVLFLFVTACSQTIENEEDHVVIEDNDIEVIDDTYLPTGEGDTEELEVPIEYSAINKRTRIMDDGDTIEINSISWRLKEHVLRIWFQAGMSEWDAYRLENNYTDFFNKKVVPEIYEIELHGVRFIPDDAFWGLSEVTKVDMGESLMYIGYEAFEGCKKIQELMIPDSVQIVEGYAFQICPALTKCNIPESCSEWGEEVFTYSGIEELTIPVSTRMLYEGECLLKKEQLIFAEEMFEEEVDAICLKRLILTGEITDKINLSGFLGLPVCEIVFTENPPEKWEVPFTPEDDVVVYYLNDHALEWAPNGETEWNGFPIVGIDSLDELPPVA